MNRVIYKGYKKKWNLVISGYHKRVNDNGYIQILDKNTHRWVTVDSCFECFLEDSEVKNEVN